MPCKFIELSCKFLNPRFFSYLCTMITSIITTLPMFVCGILSVQLALTLCNRWDWPRLRLLLFMLTATMLYVAHCIFFNRQTEVIPLSDTLYNFCNPAVYPLYFIYIEELTQHHPNRLRQSLLILPSVLCCLAVGILFGMMDRQETALFIQQYLYADDYQSLSGIMWWQAIVHQIVRAVFALQIPPILIIGWRRIKQYNKIVENNYSNTEGKTLYQLQTMLALFVLATIVSFVCNIIGRQMFTDSIWLLAIPSLTFSALLLLIGHLGLLQNFSVSNIEAEQAAEEPIAGSLVLEEKRHDVYERLQRDIVSIVEKERLYLQPNLKINDLAKLLNTNRNYLYHALNEGMGMSFSEFINSRRIEFAVRQIKANPSMLLSDIASAAGFTSVSAFYRNFKQFKHCTPSEFQQTIQLSTPTGNRSRFTTY